MNCGWYEFKFKIYKINGAFMSKDFIKIPNMEHNMCFGCGPANAHGLRMVFWGNDDMVYSEIALPHHFTGWQGVVHGGILSTLLDEVMSWGAIFLTRKFILTKSMTVNYHKPVFSGDKLRLESVVEGIPGERECLMKGRIYNSSGEIATSAIGTFAVFTIDSVKKMGIMSEKDIHDFEMIINSHK